MRIIVMWIVIGDDDMNTISDDGVEQSPAL